MEKEVECVECNTNSVYVNLNVYVVSTYGPSLLQPSEGWPSCLQTTWAASELNLVSQTVPQALLMQISTLPSISANRPLPPASLNSPCKQLAAAESENLLEESHSRFTVRGL